MRRSGLTCNPVVVVGDICTAALHSLLLNRDRQGVALKPS
jgi:hypothetical protein